MEKIAALLLAAGRSQRMGVCKLLLPLADRPVIHHSFAALREGGVDDITLVLGPDGAAVSEAVQEFRPVVVWNRELAGDMASSIRLGLRLVSPEVSGVVIHLADYPLVRPATVAALLKAHAAHPGRIIIPRYKEKTGHPVLFPRPVLAEIDQAPTTLREIVRKDAARCMTIAVSDPGILADMDTPPDYDAMRRQFPLFS